MKAQLALRMKYRLAAVRKRHYVPHGSGARARAKLAFVGKPCRSTEALVLAPIAANSDVSRPVMQIILFLGLTYAAI